MVNSEHTRHPPGGLTGTAADEGGPGYLTFGLRPPPLHGVERRLGRGGCAASAHGALSSRLRPRGRRRRCGAPSSVILRSLAYDRADAESRPPEASRHPDAARVGGAGTPPRASDKRGDRAGAGDLVHHRALSRIRDPRQARRRLSGGGGAMAAIAGAERFAACPCCPLAAQLQDELENTYTLP